MGKSSSQTMYLRKMNSQLQDLHRQLSTQKKYDQISGFGTKAFQVQDLRADVDRLGVYQENNKKVTTRMQMMMNSMDKMIETTQGIQDSVLIQTRSGEVELSDINNIANTGMRFMEDLLNTSDGSRYLFGGSASQSKPMDALANMEANFKAEIDNWLDGSQSYADMMNNIDNFTDAELGLNTDLSLSGKVTTKISDGVDVDYTALANEKGFKTVLKGIALAKAAKFPDVATDIGTEAEFHQMLDEVNGFLKSGVEEMRSTSFRLGSEYNLLKDMEDQNQNDIDLSQSLLSDMEDADPTDTVVKIQSMQTQLTSSYEVTRIMSQLSLVNYM
jgi:flagellar hook-associated protein 3 FlgL